MVLQGTIFGSTRKLSNQGSLKNHFLKEFYKDPIKVSQRTFKHGSLRQHFWFQKELSNQGSLNKHFLKEFYKDPIKVSQRTFKHGSLRHHFWFHKEPFKPGFFKEPFR